MNVEIINEGFEDIKESKTNGTAVILILIIIIWWIGGLTAFLTSIICFAFYGTMTDKFLGLLISLILGPFYWLYFIFNNTGYCSRSPPNVF
jgi:hypothetical protein